MNSFLKKRGLNRMDLCYLAALTLIGLGIRVILRVVITDDWLMCRNSFAVWVIA